MLEPLKGLARIRQLDGSQRLLEINTTQNPTRAEPCRWHGYGHSAALVRSQGLYFTVLYIIVYPNAFLATRYDFHMGPNPLDSPCPPPPITHISILPRLLHWNSSALPETNSPIINPNSPSTELKISMTRILTNLPLISPLFFPLPLHPPFLGQLGITHKLGSAASANAAPLPLIPTLTPHTRLHIPTVKPAQKRA